MTAADKNSYLYTVDIKIIKYKLQFKRAAGTSRGILRHKNTWFIKLFDSHNSQEYGLGEINMFEGLSYDDRADFYLKLEDLEQYPDKYINSKGLENLCTFPAIRFGLEIAMLDYEQNKERILFPSNFTKGKDGIPINGLIWMGEKAFMLEQIEKKIDQGFRCLKMKIGAIDFQSELAILKSIRQKFSAKDLELRLDANGAFDIHSALQNLQQLSQFEIHSIEQPIKQGQILEMARLCKESSIPIALDEELIGIHDYQLKEELLQGIKPQYIIIKPSLVGGFSASEEWIKLAKSMGVGWWITSALESNIGLNAISQWTYQLNTPHYQGLGTGQLFTNNITSPLVIRGERLFYNPEVFWRTQDLFNKK